MKTTSFTLQITPTTRRILLAEDNAINRELVEFHLHAANYTVDSVANGVEAEEWLDGIVAGVRALRVGEQELAFTMSAGGCLYLEKDLEIDPLVNRADENLYASKEGGRNRATWSFFKT